MTFTKEKLQQLENAIYDTIHGLRTGNPHPRDVDLVVQAAQSLPKYIAALDEAAMALQAQVSSNNWNTFECDREGFRMFKEANRLMEQALATIRQLARGKE